MVASRADIVRLVKWMDANGDGKIDYMELESAIRRFRRLCNPMAVAKEQRGRRMMRKLAENLAQENLSVRQFFDFLDSSGDGVVAGYELSESLTRRELLTKHEATEALHYMDPNADDVVQLHELEAAFSRAGRPIEALEEDAKVGAMFRILEADMHRRQFRITDLMRKLDVDGDGTIDLDEFEEGLMRMVNHDPEIGAKLRPKVDTGSKIQVTYGRRHLRPKPPVCCHRGGGQAFTRSAHNIVPKIRLHSLRPPPIVGLHRIARTARVPVPPTTPQLAPSRAQTHRESMQLKFHLDDATSLRQKTCIWQASLTNEPTKPVNEYRYRNFEAYERHLPKFHRTFLAESIYSLQKNATARSVNNVNSWVTATKQDQASVRSVPQITFPPVQQQKQVVTDQEVQVRLSDKELKARRAVRFGNQDSRVLDHTPLLSKGGGAGGKHHFEHMNSQGKRIINVHGKAFGIALERMETMAAIHLFHTADPFRDHRSSSSPVVPPPSIHRTR